MRLINLLFILLVVSACRKKEDFSYIQVIGHAGMGLEMPNSMYHDNSKEAIEYALQMRGCDGVEVDVQLSEDGDLWLYHDTNLDSQTNTSGCISELGFSELNAVKYTSLHHEKLIRLKDLDSSFLIGKTLYLDIRKINFCTNTEINSQSILESLNAISFVKNPQIKVIVLSNNLVFLNAAHDIGFQVAFEINENLNFLDMQSTYSFVKEIVVKNKHITLDQVVNYQAAGIKVTIFEMRSAVGIRKALRKKPNSILTDDLREALIEVGVNN
jgi:glycerophosphoryl diester phosphodiesterase